MRQDEIYEKHILNVNTTKTDVVQNTVSSQDLTKIYQTNKTTQNQTTGIYF